MDGGLARGLHCSWSGGQNELVWRLEFVMAVEQAFMCGKSCRVDTVVVSSLIMLPGELMDRHGGCKASGEAGFKKRNPHNSQEFSIIDDPLGTSLSSFCLQRIAKCDDFEEKEKLKSHLKLLMFHLPCLLQSSIFCRSSSL